MDAPGTDSSTPFDEQALRWMLFLGMGWTIAGGFFLLLAGFNHIVEIFRDRNSAPGNTAMLISNLGVPILLLVLLISTGSI